MEIEMRVVIFSYCRQVKGEKIHHKLSDVYGKDSYAQGAVKYWIREFKAQRTDPHDEIRPGRPLIGVSAQIARLLNDNPFGSTRHLARQLAITKEVVKKSAESPEVPQIWLKVGAERVQCGTKGSQSTNVARVI
jgi:hypothetical protein